MAPLPGGQTASWWLLACFKPLPSQKGQNCVLIKNIVSSHVTFLLNPMALGSCLVIWERIHGRFIAIRSRPA